jgi:hypothetical protein
MGSRSREPKPERPPDLEIGATVRADQLRFSEQPEAEVKFTGRSIAKSESGSERENLPDEVEAGVTYENVRVGWRAAAWVENAVDLPEPSGSGEGEGSR